MCCRKTALERSGLRDLGVTHVLNAAEGKWNNVLTGADYYTGMDIQYYGVEADDKPTFNISQYFCPAAQFIHEALRHPQSKSCRKSKPFSSGEAACTFLMNPPAFTSCCSRQGAGALCDGSEQVGDSGPGVPDDEAQLISGGCHRACATAPMHPAQSRLPETAQGPGHHATRGAAETKTRDARTIVHNR